MAVDDVSERIKRAALSRFVEVGFGSSTVDQIAAAAGVGVASLYRRWPDKAALANELVVDYLDAFDSALDSVEGGRGKEHSVDLLQRLLLKSISMWSGKQAEGEGKKKKERL